MRRQFLNVCSMLVSPKTSSGNYISRSLLKKLEKLLSDDICKYQIPSVIIEKPRLDIKWSITVVFMLALLILHILALAEFKIIYAHLFSFLQPIFQRCNVGNMSLRSYGFPPRNYFLKQTPRRLQS